MMTAAAYNVDNFETLPDDLQAYLDARDRGLAGVDTGLEPFSYARYWHGYLIWLRPLLLVLTYGQVRVVNYIVFFALAGALLWRLWKVCGRWPAVWFAASQLAVSAFFAPRQVQFFTCFAIGYAACLWVLAKPRAAGTLAVGLVAVGVCTSFLDLLVTPILTLGLPLTVWLLDPRVPGGQAPLRRCGAVAGGAVCWGAGYALCWASKWVLAGLVTGQDIVGDALHQAAVRTSADTWHGMELTWGNIFRFVYDTLNSRGLFWPLIAAVLACAALFALCLRSRQALCAALPLLLAALSAPGLAGAAAHPFHPARVVHLAQPGRYGVRRAGVCAPGVQPVRRPAAAAPKKGLTAGGRRTKMRRRCGKRALHPFREYDNIRYQM